MLKKSIIIVLMYNIVRVLEHFNLFCIQDKLVIMLIDKNLILLLICTCAVYLCLGISNILNKIIYIYIYISLINIKNSFISLNSGINSNFGLSNKIALYHPLLVLVSISLLILLLFVYTELNFKSVQYIFRCNAMITIYALITGSYWSSQEVLWGGWWSWDLVETSLLFINILLIIIVHSMGKKKKLHKVHIFKGKLYMVLYIIYLTNHTPIINSIHSFVSGSSIFLSYTQLIFWLLLPIILFKLKLTHFYVYIISLYYIIVIGYVYSYTFGISISSEIKLVTNLLICYLSLIILSVRKKRILTLYLIFFGYKSVLIMFIYNLLFILYIPMLPITNVVYLSIRKIRYIYRHALPYLYIIIYYLFFLSYMSVPKNKIYCFLVKKKLIFNYITLSCTEKKIYYNGSIYSSIVNELRPKLYFIWGCVDGLDTFGIKSSISSIYVFSNFI